MNLNQRTIRVLELKRNIGSNLWLLGTELLQIKESKIYLEKYGMFEEYLEKEVDLARATAYKYMQIAKEFDAQLVQEWGAKKCNLLITLKEPERKEIMQIHTPSDSFEAIRKTTRALKANEDETEEIDYFVYTEEILSDTLHKINLCKDHLYGCSKKDNFKAFPRKARIIELWRNIEKEVTNGNVNRIISKMEN